VFKFLRKLQFFYFVLEVLLYSFHTDHFLLSGTYKEDKILKTLNK